MFWVICLLKTLILHRKGEISRTQLDIMIAALTFSFLSLTAFIYTSYVIRSYFIYYLKQQKRLLNQKKLKQCTISIRTSELDKNRTSKNAKPMIDLFFMIEYSSKRFNQIDWINKD